MENSKYRTLSRILRVGKELLVLLEITILTNKEDENDTSWFTDNVFMDVLLLLREPIYGRMNELMKKEIKTRGKMTNTGGVNTGRSEAHCFLVGEKVKVGLQFKRHSVSKTCLAPIQGAGPRSVGSTCHSGGGYEKMILFPEKVQVVVCDNDPLRNEMTSSRGTASTEAELRPTSRYFKAANPGGGTARAPLTSTAKKKRLTLKKIVSKKNSSTSGGGGFPVTSDHSVSQTLRTNLDEDCELICQDNTGQKGCHFEENEVNIEEETNELEEIEDVVQIEDNLNAERGIIRESEIRPTESDHGRSNIRDGESIQEGHEENCLQSKRISCVSSEYSDDEDVHDLEEKEEDTDVSETCGTSKTEVTRKHTSEVCQNRLYSDVKSRKTMADTKNRDIKYQDVLSDGSCSDPRDEYCPDTDGADGLTGQAYGGDWHTDESDGQLVHSKRNIAPSSQRDQTDRQRSNTDQADNSNGSKRLSQNAYKEIESSQEGKSKSDDNFEDILSENEDFIREESHDRKSRKNAISSNRDGRCGDGLKRVKKRLYTDAVGGDLKTGSTCSRQSTPILSPSPFEEDRKGDRCRAGDDTGQAENEMLTRGTDSGIDGQSLNKRKKRKLKRRRREKICLSSSDEDSCQVDISHLLQEKDFNRNVLNSENERNLGDGTEESHSLEINHASRKLGRIIDRETKTASYIQDTDRDSLINSINSARTGKTTQHLVSDDSNQRTSLTHSNQVSKRSSALPNSDDEMQSEDDLILQKEPFVDTVEAINDDNVCAEHLNENVVNDGQWDGKGCGGKIQRMLVDHSRRDEFTDDEDHFVLISDHADGISHQPDSDESLPEVSYAKNMEEKAAADVTMATDANVFTDTAKELSHSSCNSVTVEDLQNGSSDGQEHDPLGEDNDFRDVTDQTRVKITSDTGDSDKGTRGKSIIESNSLLPAKSSDQPRSWKTFFRASDYENLESENETFVPKPRIGGISKNKKRLKPIPHKATNLKNNKSFGSLKRYDDTMSKKRSRRCVGGRRESQIEVTPENCDSWWTTKGKKEKKAEVIDLVAMDDQMVESLKTVKKITELSEDQLQYLTKDNEGYLREIFQGKRACVRHTQYKKSSAFRAEMTYLVSYGDFTQEHLETIMDTLVPIFCKRGSKFLDYVSKVLLPELLVKISMDVLHLNYQDAESLF